MSDAKVQRNSEDVDISKLKTYKADEYTTDLSNYDQQSCRTTAQMKSKTSKIELFCEPRPLPPNANSIVFAYVFSLLASDLVVKIGIGAVLFFASTFGSKTFELFITFLFFLAIFKLLANLIFWLFYGSRTPELRINYFFESLLNVGYVVFLFGCFGFFKGTVSISSLVYYVIPHIIFSVLRLFAGTDLLIFTVPPAYTMIESIQIMYIVKQLENPELVENWTLILFFSYFAIIGFSIFSFILFVMTCVFTFNVYKKEIDSKRQDWSAVIVLSSITFYCIWNAIAYYFLLSGLQVLLEQARVIPNPKEGPLPYQLSIAGPVLFICGIISLLLLTCIFSFLRKHLLLFFNKSKVNGMSTLNFIKQIKPNVQRLSVAVFSPSQHIIQETLEEVEQPGEVNCHLCFKRQSDVLLYPCMHQRTCRECIYELLDSTNLCITCKTPLQQVFIVQWNFDKKEFEVIGQITISH